MAGRLCGMSIYVQARTCAQCFRRISDRESTCWIPSSIVDVQSQSQTFMMTVFDHQWPSMTVISLMIFPPKMEGQLYLVSHAEKGIKESKVERLTVRLAREYSRAHKRLRNPLAGMYTFNNLNDLCVGTKEGSLAMSDINGIVEFLLSSYNPVSVLDGGKGWQSLNVDRQWPSNLGLG